ncbi:hypothetical protein HRI_004372200 [Hibiscus trionum]|uniref:RNase H type-1 domain-containing protein n=1 Tax=Hibiscus trionum TaxID=183268 RepID=A0A9W7MPN3_HIBTR|nr:hypothetical protein HRI_004372200 [Hibiscus trionum]
MVWVISFFAFCWSIWLFRNDLIFNNSRMTADQLFAVAQIKTFKWCNYNWPKSFFSESYFLANPAGSFCPIAKAKRYSDSSFDLPNADYTFFVDGAVNGSFGEAGIGGLCRDNNGIMVAKFSKSIGVLDATSAELLAIKEACSICLSAASLIEKRILFASDSSLAVNWIRNPIVAPLIFRPLAVEISNWSAVRDWKFEFIYRECNSEADSLAKNGIANNSNFRWIADSWQ